MIPNRCETFITRVKQVVTRCHRLHTISSNQTVIKSPSSNQIARLSHITHDQNVITNNRFRRTPRWRYIPPLRSKMCRLPRSPLWFETSNVAVRKLRVLIKRFIQKWPLHSHPAFDVDYSDRAKLKFKSLVKRKLNHRSSDLAIVRSHLFKDRDEIALCLKAALAYPLNPVDVNICLTACVIAQMTRRGEEIYRIITDDQLSLNFHSSSMFITIFLQQQDIERASVVLVRLLTEHANCTTFDQNRSQQLSDLISSFINSVISSTLSISGQDVLNRFHTIFLSFSPSSSNKSTVSLSPFRSSHFDLLCSSSCVRHQLLQSPERAHQLLQSISRTITANLAIDHSQPSHFVLTTIYRSFVNARAHRWIVQLYDIAHSSPSFSHSVIGYDKLLLAFAAVENQERFRSLVEEWLAIHAGDFDTSDAVLSAFLKIVFQCINDSSSNFAHSLSSLVQSLTHRFVKSIYTDVATSSPRIDSGALTGNEQELIAIMLVSLSRCGRRGSSLKLANRFAVALTVHPDELAQHPDLFALNLSYHVMVAQMSSQLEPVFALLSSQSNFFASYPDVLHQIAISCIRLCKNDVSAAHSTEIDSKSESLLVRLVTLLESDVQLFAVLRPSTLFTIYSHLQLFEHDSAQCITPSHSQSHSNNFLRSIIKHAKFLIKHPQSGQFAVSPTVLRSDDLVAIIDLLLACASKSHLHHVVNVTNQQPNSVLAQWNADVVDNLTRTDLSKRSFIEYLQQSPSQFCAPADNMLEGQVTAECVDNKSPCVVVLDLPIYDFHREQMLGELIQRGQSFLIDATDHCVFFLSGGIQSCLHQQEWACFDQLLISEVDINKTTFSEKLWRRHEVRKRAKRIRDRKKTCHNVGEVKVSNKAVNKRPTRKTNVLHHTLSE